MTETNFPQLMECLHDLIRTKRYHDAEQLLADARNYAHTKPPPDETWVLVAEAMRERLLLQNGVMPTKRQLADYLVALKFYPAATKDVLDKVLAT